MAKGPGEEAVGSKTQKGHGLGWALMKGVISGHNLVVEVGQPSEDVWGPVE